MSPRILQPAGAGHRARDCHAHARDPRGFVAPDQGAATGRGGDSAGRTPGRATGLQRGATIPDVERLIEQTENLISLLLGITRAPWFEAATLTAQEQPCRCLPGCPLRCSNGVRTSGRRSRIWSPPTPSLAWQKRLTFRSSP